MSKSKNGCPGAATPEQPTEKRSCDRDQLAPQINDSTDRAAGQEKSAWNYDDEIRMVDYIVVTFIRPSHRKLSKYLRGLVYNDAMKEVNRYPFSCVANLYARKKLAKMLRL